MQFLAPLFLAGLAAVAIPIVLHLIQRERRAAVPFPSLMFLSRIPHHDVRRRRLRDLPLLLLRVLALVLLAAAFARPLLERSRSGIVPGATARDVVLLLDRSYSMGAGGRWTQARDAALREISRLGPADRMSIVVFDAGAAVLSQPTGDVATLRSLVSGVRPGQGTTRYDPALRLAANLLNASTLPRREVVMISDLQRVGAGDGLEARLPAGTVLRTVSPDAPVGPNLAVADVSFRREPVEGRVRITPTVRVVNTGGSAVGSTLTLQLDGRTLETRPVTVAAHAAASVALTPFTLAGAAQGTVALGDDGVAADNTRYFTLSPGQSLSVLVVDGRPDASLFLARALEVGGQPGFTVTVRRGLAGAADLRGRDVVVLNDARAPAGEALRALRAWVEAGGGLVVAAGPGVEADPALDALLPGALGGIRDRTADGGASLGSIDLSHPVFEIFRARHSGDLGAVRFYRFRPLQVATRSADSSVTVLARFDDGGVALAERRVGRGHVLAWGSTFDREWNDLVVQPVFVPFVHELLKYAAGYEPPRSAQLVGEVADARTALGVADSVPLLAQAPDGSRSRIEPGSRTLPLQQSGFYLVRRAEAGDTSHAAVAANVDVRESDLTALSAADFSAAVRTPGASAAPVAAATMPTEERERRQALWWDLLVIALALLALETALSNRRGAARRARGEA